MGEIKSAFEKAMERVEKLGKLSPEEMRERKEVEYTTLGQALAKRYLGHGHSEVFKEEMSKYSGEEKEIVAKAALSTLVEAIELRDYEVTEKATAAILTLKGSDRVGEIREKMGILFKEYDEAKQRKYEQEKEQIVRWERELLHQLRVSGSAVGEINKEASEAWKKILHKLYSQFDERLRELKQRLLSL